MGWPRADKAIRWNGEEFELRCNTCLEYWSLTDEFWRVGRGGGLSRCRACANDASRESTRRRVATSRAMNERIAWQKRLARIKADPTLLAQYRERTRKATRRWSEKHRDELAAKQRERYVQKIGRELIAGIGRPRRAA